MADWKIPVGNQVDLVNGVVRAVVVIVAKEATLGAEAVSGVDVPEVVVDGGGGGEVVHGEES